MYVWARLARTVLTRRRRGPYRIGEECALDFRCLPSDIDPNFHLNNARYMMLADVGRIDLYIRSGIFGLTRARGWSTLMGGLQSVYVREVRLWSRFQVVSSIETFEDRQLFGRHRFILADGTVAASIVTTAGIYDWSGRRFLPIGEILAELGQSSSPPRDLTGDELAFARSHEIQRASIKARRAAFPR